MAIAMRKFAQVVTEPEKFIAFVDDDPGGVVVEPKMPLDRQRDLDGGCGIMGRAMRDR